MLFRYDSSVMSVMPPNGTPVGALPVAMVDPGRQ